MELDFASENGRINGTRSNDGSRRCNNGCSLDVGVDVSCTEAACVQLESGNEHLFDCQLKGGRCVCQEEMEDEGFHAGCTENGGFKRLG